MSEYSATPLPRKLGIKAGGRVLLLAAPVDFEAADLAELPDGVVVDKRERGAPYDVVLLFVRSAAALHERFATTTQLITPAGRLWVAWPRKAGGFASDVDENAIRDLAIETGLVDNKVAAISDAWSGLQIVYRLTDRPARGG